MSATRQEGLRYISGSLWSIDEGATDTAAAERAPRSADRAFEEAAGLDSGTVRKKATPTSGFALRDAANG